MSQVLVVMSEVQYMLRTRTCSSKSRSNNRSLIPGLRSRQALAALCIFALSSLVLHGANRGEARAMQSKIMGRAVRYSALLPPSYDADLTRRYPVLYYLHGL